jgi:hypothetical protein
MYIIRVNMKNYFFGKKEKVKEPEQLEPAEA